MLIQFPGVFLGAGNCLTGVDKINVCIGFLTCFSWENGGKEKNWADKWKMRLVTDAGVAVLLWLGSGVLFLEPQSSGKTRPRQQGVVRRMLNWNEIPQNNPGALMWLLLLDCWGSVSRKLMMWHDGGRGLQAPALGFYHQVSPWQGMRAAL